MPLQPAPTIHDALSEADDKTVGAPEAPATTTPAPADTTSTATPAVESKDTRTTEERARDESGRFVKQEAKEPASGVVKQTEKPAAPAAVSVSPAPRIGVKRPDSWKKELWPIWDKLDAGEQITPEERKQLLEYTHEREGQFTKGVSAYKAEAENARRLIGAITPYQEMMQSQGITPEKFIHSLASTHQVLSSGTPQQKLATFARFAQDYGIPLQELLIQGEDGKVYLNQQYFEPPKQEGPKPTMPEDIQKTVAQALQQQQMLQAINQFTATKDTSGQPKYPHLEAVKQTMGGLLHSGLVPNTGNHLQDLETAYEAALKLPQHAELYKTVQEQNRQLEAQAKAKEEADRAARARAAAVSPKSDTPTGTVAGGGKKGLRAALESAYDTHVTGRI